MAPFNSNHIYDFNDTLYKDYGTVSLLDEFEIVLTWIVSLIGFPLILLAIYALYSLVRIIRVSCM